MNPTVNDDARRLAAGRIMLIVILILAVGAALALAPAAFETASADWQVGEVFGSLGGRFTFETFVAVVAGARLALAVLFFATAALLLSRPPHWGALPAALALTGLPFAFTLVGPAGAATYPAPWDALLSAFTQALTYAGAAALFLLLFLFPDGRFYPPRMRLPALAALIAMAAGIVGLLFIEEAWFVFILAFLIALLLGLVGQALRYRSADPDRRRQTIGFLVAVIALPIWALIGMGAISPVLSLAAGYALMALLPAGLILGVARGLWGGVPAKRSIHRFALATGGLLFLSVIATFLLWQNNKPATLADDALSAVPPRSVIIDTDMSMDDSMAILYLLQHPAVDVRAITVNGVAFTHCREGVRNVLGLLEVAGAPADIAVSCGRETPYAGGHPAPDDWRKLSDQLYGAQVRPGRRTPDPRPAAELLAETINAAPGEITVVTLGPLTNLADALQADPQLAGRIVQIVSMGGAVDAPGNVSDPLAGIDNDFAEWNIYADPQAAEIMLASGAPIALVPLDATNDVPIKRSFYQRLNSEKATREATFVYNLLYLNEGFALSGGTYFWDPLAAVVVTNPEVVALRQTSLDVVTEEGPESGRTHVSSEGRPVTVAYDADARRFEALFLAALNQE